MNIIGITPRLKIGSLLVLVVCLVIPAGRAEGKMLWQIGDKDNHTADLALGPKSYGQFNKDALFLVGHSNPKSDWPYVHPGPDDGWAGGGSHTFTILFGLTASVGTGDSRLIIDLTDTHDRTPPQLAIDINGHLVRHAVPKGGPDASIMGDPAQGREHRILVPVPAGVLRSGLNEIKITNSRGSWVLYDWLGLEVPDSTLLQMATVTRLESVKVNAWLSRHKGTVSQPVAVELIHLGKPSSVVLQVTGLEPVERRLAPGWNKIALRLPPVSAETPLLVTVRRDGKLVGTKRTKRYPAREREPVDYVDPLLGTATSRWMLYPGPSVPFSMVKLSPDNEPQRWKAGYEYSINNIAGFSHLHSWTMGGLLTMPVTGPLKTIPGPAEDPDAGYRSRIRHEEEKASPGYYGVTLDDYGIRAELTSTTRAGMQRYTFSKADQARILIDLLTPTEYGYTVHDARITKVSDTEIEGYSKQQSGRYANYNEFILHFAVRFNKPFKTFGGWTGKTIHRDVSSVSGKGDIGGFVEFSTRQGEVIIMQSGVSLVSIDQARLNLDTEMSKFEWDFDAVRKQARRIWSELFGLIEVEGGTEEEKTKFFTNLYRSYCARTIWSDVNGKYVDMNEKVQQLPDPDSPVYGCDAFWNTFWNLNQLWSLITPKTTRRWVDSLLEIYDKGGWLAKGPTGIEYSSIMVASHEIALIVAAYQQGIRDFDVAKAYEAMRHIQTEPGRPYPGGGHVGNRQLASYMELGYVPVEKGPVSNTLEYGYDDWCVAQMAKALKKENDYRMFVKRAANYKNVFDSEVGYSRQKHADGRWVKGFSPFSGSGFVEGNSWQYTWFVPHDVKGLIELMGREEFNRRLHKGLQDSAESNFNAAGDQFARYPVNHGNQPNMQSAWLFNYSGKPWLTQHWVREILKLYYGTGPFDGYPGDEDQGQMGAWYVMSAMGLFQMDGGCSVKPIYELGSPIFDRVVIHLDKTYYPGGQFVIETKDNSDQNRYIQSATLNGKPLNKPWIYHSELVKGGRLVLELGPEPNKEWGSAPEAAPPQG